MYVNELSEQNEILVETVEELEREANERVALVESKLQRSGASLKVMIHGPQYISSLLLTFFLVYSLRAWFVRNVRKCN